MEQGELVSVNKCDNSFWAIVYNIDNKSSTNADHTKWTWRGLDVQNAEDHTAS